MERRGPLWIALGLVASCGGTSTGDVRHSDAVADASVLAFDAGDPRDSCAGAIALSTGPEGQAVCVVKGDGSLWCWGDGGCGTLGLGGPAFTTAPLSVAVPGNGAGSGVKAISVGWGTACAVDDTGTTACWGATLPWGDPWCTGTPPTTVLGLPGNIATIATGYDHACAVATDGSAWCWGTNTSGQLGDGTLVDRPRAERVQGLTSGVAAISTAHGDSCAVKTDGSLWCWGWNYAGELGDGTTTTRNAPVPVFGMSSGVVEVAVGGAHSCAVKADGSVWCWGNNGDGDLGDGTTDASLVPVRVKLAARAKAVSTGYAHACAITDDGGVWCWGDNVVGALGYPTASCDAGPCASPTPAPVLGLPSDVVSLTAAYFSTCALERDGTVWCWGKNDGGELGDGKRTPRSTPRRVLPCGG